MFFKFALVIFIVPASIQCLLCHKCSARTEAECIAAERPELCEESEDACLHVRYSYYMDTGKGTVDVKQVHSKRCTVSVLGDCSLYCDKNVLGKQYFNCKQTCCSNRNYCNSVSLNYTTSDNNKISTASRIHDESRDLHLLAWLLYMCYLYH